MNGMNEFKNAMNNKCVVKIIAGIDNRNIENVRNVISAANQGGANAIDVCFDKNIYDMAREMTNLPIFVSSIVPSELAQAAQWGADALEVGNYDVLYKKGMRVSASDVRNIVSETLRLLDGQNIFMSVTIPGHITVDEQIELAHWLETQNVNLIQTEGAATVNTQKTGSRGILETAEVSLANTMELSMNTDLPIMTASGIGVQTAKMAFAAGASAIGVGSAVNKCDSLISMIAVVRTIMDNVNSLRRETLNV